VWFIRTKGKGGAAFTMTNDAAKGQWLRATGSEEVGVWMKPTFKEENPPCCRPASADKPRTIGRNERDAGIKVGENKMSSRKIILAEMGMAGGFNDSRFTTGNIA
jgi:hypothetical protein